MTDTIESLAEELYTALYHRDPLRWESVIRDHLTRARALGPEWQDISTAPKDGTSVLVYERGDICTAWFDEIAAWSNNRQKGRWMSSDEVFTGAPSHWMPLPQPPKEPGQ